MKTIARNTIVYLPKLNPGITNEYVYNMVDILQDEYFVTGDLARPISVLQMLKTKAVFLNWGEASLGKKMMIQLLFYQMFGAKIIWVFHNKYPHGNVPDKRVISNMNWLARHSDIIVLHSKNSKKYIPGAGKNKKKAVYVPHILYKCSTGDFDRDTLKSKYGISHEDFVFTMYGRVLPSKHFEKGIEIFKKLQLKNAKLLIAGKAYDHNYAKKIKDLCKECNSIILDLHFLSTSKLNAVIDISDVIILPYESGSYMNSGVMIQSFSRGKTVITPAMCMAQDIAAHKFIYMYRKALDQAMLKAYKNGKAVNKDMGDKARDYVNKNNNREVTKKRIYEMLK